MHLTILNRKTLFFNYYFGNSKGQNWRNESENELDCPFNKNASTKFLFGVSICK